MRPLFLCIAVAATVLLLAACGRPGSPTAPPALASLSVRTAQVEAASLPLLQTLTATVRPRERATLAARVMGAVTGADFAVGQRVKAGDLLLSLSAAEIPARLAQARAALAQAEREAAREASLVQQKAAPADNALNAEDRRRIAAAVVAEAEALLAYTHVTAPFDGRIAQKLVHTGDLAQPGAPLLVIEATDHFRAEVQVPETLADLALDSAVLVQLTPDTSPVSAALVELSAAADPVTRTRLAKLALPPTAAARSGQFVRVLWPAGQTSALVIPATALSVLGQMERVFVVTPEGRAQLRLVKSGAPAGGDRLTILAGLTVGEAVVLAPAATLRDGQPVTLQP